MAMTFGEWLQPVDAPVGRASRDETFRGGMSFACLAEAARRGRSALMVYLLAWHLTRGDQPIVFGEGTCGLAGLSPYQRREGLRALCREAPLLNGSQRIGAAARVIPVDPFPTGGLFFPGGVCFASFTCAFRCHKGPALAVYLAAQLEFTLHGRTGPVRLGQAARERLGLAKSPWNRSIYALRDAGLLDVIARPGASPMVTPRAPGFQPIQAEASTRRKHSSANEPHGGAPDHFTESVAATDDPDREAREAALAAIAAFEAAAG